MNPENQLGNAEVGSTVGPLTSWWRADVLDGVFWTSQVGTVGDLVVEDGGPADEMAPELMWSTRAATVPSTRGVVLLDGPGFGSTPSEAFELAHSFAEDVADFLSVDDAEVGPIEVLVFRPDTDAAGWPEPVVTTTGVEFDFVHSGGTRVHLALTAPTTDSEA